MSLFVNISEICAVLGTVSATSEKKRSWRARDKARRVPTESDLLPRRDYTLPQTQPCVASPPLLWCNLHPFGTGGPPFFAAPPHPFVSIRLSGVCFANPSS